MIDSLLKDYLDPAWEKAATPLVRMGATPNQVTAAGLVLICACSGLYLLHRSNLVFGLTLAFAFAFDALDGAVARRRNLSSKRGGYFDAIVDRYQELAVLAAIAAVSGCWPAAMFAFAGGLFTSYAKARTALEIPVGNAGWPDFFERLERIVFLCALLILTGFVAAVGFSAAWATEAGLWLFALLTHATALQRISRAWALLKEADERD